MAVGEIESLIIADLSLGLQVDLVAHQHDLYVIVRIVLEILQPSCDFIERNSARGVRTSLQTKQTNTIVYPELRIALTS